MWGRSSDAGEWLSQPVWVPGVEIGADEIGWEAWLQPTTDWYSDPAVPPGLEEPEHGDMYMPKPRMMPPPGINGPPPGINGTHMFGAPGVNAPQGVVGPPGICGLPAVDGPCMLPAGLLEELDIGADVMENSGSYEPMKVTMSEEMVPVHSVGLSEFSNKEGEVVFVKVAAQMEEDVHLGAASAAWYQNRSCSVSTSTGSEHAYPVDSDASGHEHLLCGECEDANVIAL